MDRELAKKHQLLMDPAEKIKQEATGTSLGLSCFRAAGTVGITTEPVTWDPCIPHGSAWFKYQLTALPGQLPGRQQ